MRNPLPYITKVKKPFNKKPATTAESSDVRHEKLSFKQHLRAIQEQTESEDEYGDVPSIALSAVSKSDSNIRIDFGAHYEDGNLYIESHGVEQILSLARNESIIVVDTEFDDRWYVTRTLGDMLVVESQDTEIKGQFDFASFIKKIA